MRRRSIPRRKSEHDFTQNARRVHPKNMNTNPMRGGIRL